MTGTFLGFLAAAGLLTITPGVDTVLVLRTAIAAGPRAAAATAVGIGIGCLAWGASVSLGLGVLVAASAVAFRIVELGGAAYLVVLGVRLLVAPRRGVVVGPDRPGGRATPLGALRVGAATNLLNPKVGVFYLTFLPQFVPAGASVAAYTLLLAAIHVVLGLVWFAILIAATAPLVRLVARPGVVAALDRATGALLVAVAVKLALAGRS